MAKEKFQNINVNGLSYKLKLTTPNNPELGKDARGIIHYEKLKIFLDKNIAEELRVKTLYHELAHAFCESTSFNNMLMDKFGNDSYEIFIDKLGEVIEKFIHENNIDVIENFVKKEG